MASFLSVLAAAGCGSPEPPDTTGTTTTTTTATATPPAGCAPGELTLEDGSCQPAGPPSDMPCPPGELALEDGSCQKAGVPPSQCGQGFVPDGEDGCEPVLPADPCPEGTMAVPGDTECREVAPCGSGTWGDIPVEANTQFVDQAYAGGDGDGTMAKPWTTIQDGMDHAESGAIVAVAAGVYDEDVVIEDRPVRLWGRCPAMVEIAGAWSQGATLSVLHEAASGTEVHGVSVTGPGRGIDVSDAKEVLIGQVRVHDTGGNGVTAWADLGRPSVALEGSLIEKAREEGVSVWGSDVTVEATAVRATRVDSLGQLGTGIRALWSPGTKERSNVTVRGSLVEQNHYEGISVISSDATIEATVIRSTELDTKGKRGFGVGIWDHAPAQERSNVTVRASLVEESHVAGVLVFGSDATVEATVIRSTELDAKGQLGAGIGIQGDPDTKERSNVTIRASVVQESHSAGVLVASSDATVESTVIRSTRLDATGHAGYGISIQDTPDAQERASLTVRACLVEQNHSAGVFVFGSDATLESTVVRSTQLDAQGQFGSGIVIQEAPDTKERSNVTIRACLAEKNHTVGVLVAGSDATLESTVVRSTEPDAQGLFGGGVVIEEHPDTEERSGVTVRACLVEQSRYVGVLVVGSDATVESTVVRSTEPDGQGQFGRGISIQENPVTNEPSNATVRACLVEQNDDTGVLVLRSDATLEATAVRDTAPAADQQFGDGITESSSRLTLRNVEATGNARAGLAGFGGEVSVQASVFMCNAFDVNGEISPESGALASFGDHPDWQCSKRKPAECTEPGPCKVEQSGIQPPQALPPVDSLP